LIDGFGGQKVLRKRVGYNTTIILFVLGLAKLSPGKNNKEL
jgi:hypothetical protein